MYLGCFAFIWSVEFGLNVWWKDRISLWGLAPFYNQNRPELFRVARDKVVIHGTGRLYALPEFPGGNRDDMAAFGFTRK
jgi:hypothetical protein